MSMKTCLSERFAGHTASKAPAHTFAAGLGRLHSSGL
jgi:hypothetical protein